MAFAMQHDERKDGVTAVEADGFFIKITQRIDRKVDADKVVELAAEAGLSDQLAHLFRWKPEINMSRRGKQPTNPSPPLWLVP